jgi:hypothetical protein
MLPPVVLSAECRVLRKTSSSTTGSVLSFENEPLTAVIVTEDRELEGNRMGFVADKPLPIKIAIFYSNLTAP